MKHHILVIRDEDTFAGLLGELPHARYALAFAPEPREVPAHFDEQPPDVLVIPVTGGGGELAEVVGATWARRGVAVLGVASGEPDDELVVLCDEIVAVEEIDDVAAAVERLAGARAEAVSAGSAAVQPVESRGGEEVQLRLAEVSERVDKLERRLRDVSAGATGGLSELLQATDGLGQGLKAQARALHAFEGRLQDAGQHVAHLRSGSRRADADAGADADAAQLPEGDGTSLQLSERLDRLEVHVSDLATGITGGLSELLQAVDGLGQGLKAQARALSALEARVATLSGEGD